MNLSRSNKASQFGQRRTSITSKLSVQNGNGSLHFGQVEGILNSGVSSFLALAACSGETLSATARAASQRLHLQPRDSVLDVLDVLNLFP